MTLIKLMTLLQINSILYSQQRRQQLKSLFIVKQLKSLFIVKQLKSLFKNNLIKILKYELS
jgi:hypothetical protein